MDYQYFSGLLTTDDLCKMFGRGSLTIYLWRRKHGLPTVRLPGGKKPPVRFDADAVRAWAIRTGHKMVVRSERPRIKRRMFLNRPRRET